MTDVDAIGVFDANGNLTVIAPAGAVTIPADDLEVVDDRSQEDE